jgi:hypothetical protein
MWYWRRMEKIVGPIVWEVLHRVKEERNILHTIKIRKTNWIGHILRRNCFIKHVTERKIATGIRARRRSSFCMTVRKAEDTGSWKRKRVWTCRKTDYVIWFRLNVIHFIFTSVNCCGYYIFRLR